VPDPTTRTVSRRDVLAGSSAAALGISTLALPSGVAAASVVAPLAVTVAQGGVVYGWGEYLGEPVFGTLRTGTTNNPVQTPAEITGFSFTWPEIVQVATGNYTSFALTADGKVYAWGNGGGSLLGNGATSDRSTPVLSSLAADIRIVQVSAFFHVHALDDAGRVWAWGSSGANSGLASTTATPTDVTATLGLASTVGGPDRVVRIVASNTASAALTATGRVLTWGTQPATTGASAVPILGQNVIGTQTSATAVQLAGSLSGTAGTPAQIVQIALGPGSGAALGRDGRVHTWGRNTSGELGDGTTVPKEVPADITSVEDSALATTVGDPARRIVQVAVGSSSMLALGLDGCVYAWGSAGSGKLGNGLTSPNRTLPVDITTVADTVLPAAGAFNRIVQVLATQNSAYALGSDGRVYAWGSGDRYSLGNNATNDSSLPIDISGFGVFAELSPNTGAGATRAPRRIVQLGGGPISDGQHVLAIDDRGVV
jgi:alpha-tubulin suppressor-like RCC1 family protein